MASQPPANQLPLFYNGLAPLSSQLHPNHGLKPRGDLGFTRGTHAIPVTVDEFPLVQRNYPIVFGVGENPAPLATPDAQELSLCFDDTAGIVVDNEGEKLFAGTDPTDTTKAILQFCEQFEQAVMRTRGFMEELTKLDLLMDGEVTIQREGLAQPAVYRGFRMVDEQKLQNLRGDQARKMVQSGLMGLIYAHLFSLSLISPLFERQFAATSANAA
ncbi:MAG: multidrug transporter [Sphingomonadales bacterium 12-62-5]|nr:MAG: multidrug transporter [Sphingomonadales bacterium 12-62-5]